MSCAFAQITCHLQAALCQCTETLLFSEGCSRLTELNISWCVNVTDEGVQHVLRACPNLETLICKGCEGVGARAAPTPCLQLSADCFEGLDGQALGSLKCLNLLSCLAVADQTVERLAQHCPRLEFLCLSNCRDVTDRALQALAHGCPLLRDLELAACVNVTDAGFVSLSKNCHELERMDLEDCVLITDAALINLNSGCPNLNSLALSHCENLTDNALAELCHGHRDILRVLELDNCPQVTDAALEHMRSVEKLERVDLYDCQNITKEAIKRFKVSTKDSASC